MYPMCGQRIGDVDVHGIQKSVIELSIRLAILSSDVQTACGTGHF